MASQWQTIHANFTYSEGVGLGQGKKYSVLYKDSCWSASSYLNLDLFSLAFFVLLSTAPAVLLHKQVMQQFY